MSQPDGARFDFRTGRWVPVTSDATLLRCTTNPERVCRAKYEGCCKRCLADNHNPQLHRLYRAARAIGVPFDVLKRAIAKGALDG